MLERGGSVRPETLGGFEGGTGRRLRGRTGASEPAEPAHSGRCIRGLSAALRALMEGVQGRRAAAPRAGTAGASRAPCSAFPAGSPRALTMKTI